MRFKVAIEQAREEENEDLVQDGGSGQFLDVAVDELDRKEREDGLNLLTQFARFTILAP